MKAPERKSALHTEYKLIRNRIVELTKISKQNYYQKYFADNNKNLRKMWQGIKEIINVKTKCNDMPSCISEQNNLITNPTEISNSFNTYFTYVAGNILEKNKYKGDLTKFPNYAKYVPWTKNSISVDPVDGDEICIIIQNLNTKKSTGPTSIPSQILFHIRTELFPSGYDLQPHNHSLMYYLRY